MSIETPIGEEAKARLLKSLYYNTTEDTSKDLSTNADNSSRATHNPLIDLFIYGTLIQNDFLYLHWYSAGIDFDYAHKFTMDYYETISIELDQIAEMAVELGMIIPNPSMVSTLAPDYIPQSKDKYVYEEVLQICSKLLKIYVGKLSVARNNIEDSSIQSELDNFIRYWRKTANYFISRKLILPTKLNGFINSDFDSKLARTIVDKLD